MLFVVIELNTFTICAQGTKRYCAQLERHARFQEDFLVYLAKKQNKEKFNQQRLIFTRGVCVLKNDNL